MEPFESFEAHGMTVELYQDWDAENPYKMFDQASEILSDVQDYDLGDKVPHPEAWNRDTPSSKVMARWLTLFGGYVLAIPWSFSDYGSGGARVRLDRPDNDPANGWLVLSKESYDSEFGQFNMPLRSDDPEVHSAERTIRAEFASFAAWIEGDVSGYVVKAPNGEILDSCFGYYGETDYVRGEATTIAKDEAEERARLRQLPWLPTFGKQVG